MKKRPGSWVYEPANMKALVSTPIVKEVLARVKQNKLKAAAKPGAAARPGAAKPGAAQPGAAAGQ